MQEELNERSPELLAAMEAAGLDAQLDHTGGGVEVMRVNAPGGGQIWLTREDVWIVGFYHFGQLEEDEGVVLNWTGPGLDDPALVASMVRGILVRISEPAAMPEGAAQQ